MIYSILVVEERSVDEELHHSYNFKSQETRNTSFERTRDYHVSEGHQDFILSKDYFSFTNGVGIKETYIKKDIEKEDKSLVNFNY